MDEAGGRQQCRACPEKTQPPGPFAFPPRHAHKLPLTALPAGTAAGITNPDLKQL